MSITRILCISLFSFLYSSVGFSQFSGSNLAEIQFGKLPNEVSDAFPSFYDRLELNYKFNSFTARTTIEQYHTTKEGRSYLDLSQASLSYRKKKWDIKIGNFYETLGRGLMLRSFEIPGGVLEDIGFRSRNYFHRDILGASVKYRTKKATFHILRGDVLNNILPPTFDRSERRIDRVTAASAEVKFLKKHKAKAIGLIRESEGQANDNFLSGSLNGPIIKGLKYHIEYAQNIDDSEQSALYASLNGYKGSFSYNIEYKKYENFVLGSGLNEPPAVVKQQTYRVLNRSIHVSNPVNESGIQVDLFYNFENGNNLNINHSTTKNTFANNSFTFRQFFVEYGGTYNANSDFKLFLDYSDDPFKGESDRISAGLYSDIFLNDEVRFVPEFEFQTFNRNEQSVYNLNFLIGFNIKSKLSFSILTEITDDPFIVREDQTTRIYLGNNIRYKLNNSHTLQMFVGERRGGPQCSAGVCYEILDFRGVELRWVARFKS